MNSRSGDHGSTPYGSFVIIYPTSGTAPAALTGVPLGPSLPRRRRARAAASAWPTRSTPTTNPNLPACPAATPARASSKTAAFAAGTPSIRAASRNVSGAGLPCSLRGLGHLVVDPDLEQAVHPGRLEHRLGVGARRHDRGAQPRLARRIDVADRALVGLHAVALDHLLDRGRSSCCSGPRSSGVPARVRLLAHRAARSRGTPGRTPCPRGAASRRRTRRSRRPGRRGRRAHCAPRTSPQELVEHLLPGRVVHLGGLGDHPVHVEQAGGYRVRQA